MTDTFAPAPINDEIVSEFHWCRHYLPITVLAVSTGVSLFLSLLMLNAIFGATMKFTRSQTMRMFYPTEKKVAFLQYVICLPAFEAFVIWGSYLGVSIDGNTASIVITWIVMNIVRILLVLSSCRAVGNYRLMIHVSQCFNLPLAVMFFTDRIINSSIGIEGIFIGTLCLLALFEFFHVQDYFSVFANSQMNMNFGARTSPFSPQSAENSVDVGGREFRPQMGQWPVQVGRKVHGSDDGYPPDDQNTPLNSPQAMIAEQAYSSESEEEQGQFDDGASVTELDEALPPEVRAQFNDQGRTALIAQFLGEVMKFDVATDARVIKRTVLKFKSRFAKTNSSKPESLSGGASKSDF